jgi:hypothetical protein
MALDETMLNTEVVSIIMKYNFDFESIWIRHTVQATEPRQDPGDMLPDESDLRLKIDPEMHQDNLR